jgi:hypothetical protein
MKGLLEQGFGRNIVNVHLTKIFGLKLVNY